MNGIEGQARQNKAQKLMRHTETNLPYKRGV